jgi:hypothetical protein
MLTHHAQRTIHTGEMAAPKFPTAINWVRVNWLQTSLQLVDDLGWKKREKEVAEFGFSHD